MCYLKYLSKECPSLITESLKRLFVYSIPIIYIYAIDLKCAQPLEGGVDHQTFSGEPKSLLFH